MQLKLRRSQRQGGVLGNTVVFCLDARVEFTPQEQANLTRYKLANITIYNSEASKRALERGDAAQASGTMVGSLKNLAFSAMAAMNLNISVKSLQAGQHIECKSMDELLGAEEAIMTACQNLRGYLDTAATFDGREVLIEFPSEGPTVVAQSSTPAPMLVTPPATIIDQPPEPSPPDLPPPAPTPEPLPQYELIDGEAVPVKRTPAKGAPAPDSWAAHAKTPRQQMRDDRFGYAEPEATSKDEGMVVAPLNPRRKR